MTFKDWLNLNEDVEENIEEKENLNEADNEEKVEGSLNKLIDIMKDKKDKTSKEILDMAKGVLKTFKKNKGISKDQAEWLANTWTAITANNA